MSALLERVSDRTATWLVTKPRQVAVTLGVAMLASLAILPTLKLESGTRIFVADDDPAQVFLREIEGAFVSDDVVLIAYETDDPFSKARLQEIRTLGEKLAAIASSPERPLIDDVASLATIKDVRGEDGTFHSVPLVPEVIPDDPAGLADIRAHAKANWLIRQNLLSTNSPHIAAMVVRMVRGLTDADRAMVVAQTRQIIAEANSTITFHLAGGPVVEAD